MFCPKCKSIISKKRINNQIIEFCNCPDKLESNYVQDLEQKPTRQKKETHISSEGKIIHIKEKTKKKFVTIQDSIVKESRLPSEYSTVPLELRLSNDARLPSFWKLNQVQQRLLKQTEERYERYYRKLEDAFKGTNLYLFISFLPNDTLTDFSVDQWGLGFKIEKFEIFYAGTKLNDLASFDSKVLEKESEVILPYRLFEGYSKKLNFDYLTLGQLVGILRDDWIKYKEINQHITFQPLSFIELYKEFKMTSFHNFN